MRDKVIDGDWAVEGVTGLGSTQGRGREAKGYCDSTFNWLPVHTKSSLNICSMSDTEKMLLEAI